MQSRVTLFAAALWWGSLSAIGFLAVPLLFRYLPSPAMAGQTAAKLFAAQTWHRPRAFGAIGRVPRKPGHNGAEYTPPRGNTRRFSLFAWI